MDKRVARGNESLNSLSSADNWSPKREGGPTSAVDSKNERNRFSRWSFMLLTGRVCLWAVPPPRDWALEEGERKLKQPLSVDGVGLVRNGGRDDPTWVTCVTLCNFRQLLTTKWRNARNLVYFGAFQTASFRKLCNHFLRFLTFKRHFALFWFDVNFFNHF